MIGVQNKNKNLEKMIGKEKIKTVVVAIGATAAGGFVGYLAGKYLP